jgi:D-arabinose 1-dehydrogenase-like Zn-dependent alcohol dehydrogenase
VNVKEIIQDWMKQKGYDGLFCEYCACSTVDDLLCPYDECPGADCKAGYSTEVLFHGEEHIVVSQERRLSQEEARAHLLERDGEDF